MTTEGKEKIVSKIEKLMAMAKDSATTQNEKDVAEKLLKNLADQYFIDLEDVVKGIDKRDKWDKEIGKKYSFLVFTEHNSAYDRIARAVAEYCGVMILYGSGRHPSGQHPAHYFIFVGENSQIETADYFVTYLIRSLRKVSAHNLMRKMKDQIEGGFALEISNRLFTLRNDQTRHMSEQVHALVLVRNNDIVKFMKQEFPHIGYHNIGAVGNDKSGIGRSMAKNIGLNKGLNSGGSNKQLR